MEKQSSRFHKSYSEHLVALLVLVLAFSAIMPCVEAAPTKDVLTEWTLPNSNSHPYNIVFEDNQVYFTEGLAASVAYIP